MKPSRNVNETSTPEAACGALLKRLKKMPCIHFYFSCLERNHHDTSIHGWEDSRFPNVADDSVRLIDENGGEIKIRFRDISRLVIEGTKYIDKIVIYSYRTAAGESKNVCEVRSRGSRKREVYNIS